MSPSGNLDIIQLLGVPHEEQDPDWSKDYVYHQNDMSKTTGMSNIRQKVIAAAAGERISIPLYGLYWIEPRGEISHVL